MLLAAASATGRALNPASIRASTQEYRAMADALDEEAARVEAESTVFAEDMQYPEHPLKETPP
jgi:hypothetical protein